MIIIEYNNFNCVELILGMIYVTNLPSTFYLNRNLVKIVLFLIKLQHCIKLIILHKKPSHNSCRCHVNIYVRKKSTIEEISKKALKYKKAKNSFQEVEIY